MHCHSQARIGEERRAMLDAGNRDSTRKPPDCSVAPKRPLKIVVARGFSVDL